MSPPSDRSPHTPPAVALGLGWAGLLPFVVLAALGGVADEGTARRAVVAVVAYGAVIVSFIGGAHWGFASVRLAGGSRSATGLLALSVVPSLVAWIAVLVPPPWSEAVLAIAVIALLALDRWAVAQALAPAWWLRLRLPLSAVAAVALMVASAAASWRLAP